MTDRARSVYLGMARLFAIVGGVIAVSGIVDAVLGLGIYRGSPVWTSLFLIAIGALLHWTARSAEARPDEVEVEGGEEPGREGP